MRLTYEESCRKLQRDGWLREGDVPPMLAKPPRYDDDELGVDFFRTEVSDGDFNSLTLPRTFFGRSSIVRTSFAGSDLSDSVANWNDFEAVDFSGADLSRADLRSCNYKNVRFTAANLSGADLRCTSIEECDFTDARLDGTHITRSNAPALQLTPEQASLVEWHEEDGDDPDGG